MFVSQYYIMEKKLVFDIGMHTGQDTNYYLKEGFKVIAVEANPLFCEMGEKRFKKYIDDGSLIILNIGIADKEGVLPFYINKRTSEWSSFDFELGSRNNTPYEVMNIPCVTTHSLFEKYGVPYFFKVDIEGYDFYCINDLPEIKDGKGIKYVSCEASDVSLMDTLHQKGYTKFKLIHQAFDFKPMDLKLEKNPLFPKFLFFYVNFKIRLHRITKPTNPYSSSGPIPEKTKGEWLSYDVARGMLNDFFQGDKKKAVNGASWFDCHATF